MLMIGMTTLNLEEVVQDLTHKRLGQSSRDSSLGDGVVTRTKVWGRSRKHKKGNGMNPKFKVYKPLEAELFCMVGEANQDEECRKFKRNQ